MDVYLTATMLYGDVDRDSDTNMTKKPITARIITMKIIFWITAILFQSAGIYLNGFLRKIYLS
jgi:hypothetical protein